MHAAIDFGISNTDAVASVNGVVRHWTRPSEGRPSEHDVRAILAAGGVDLASLTRLSVTGGRHRGLPQRIGDVLVTSVDEITSIGRGGQALALTQHEAADTPILVVSAGSGTAIITARGHKYAHITGTGVGGGTLLGLGRLLLHTGDAREIDALALRGDRNGADLSLKDVISGPIGNLPSDATAVNFGKLAREGHVASREDLAAALITLVGQVIAITAINAARAERLERVVVIGHMTDMASFRTALDLVGDYYGMQLMLPADAGFGTALGAMLHEA